MEIEAGFKPSVSHLDLAALDRSPDVIYFIDRAFTLCGFNPAWVRFAEENGGQEVLKKYTPGSSILDAIPPIILDFYQSAYRAAVYDEKRFDHDFHCSSSGVFRRMHQTAYPLPKRAGLMIVNCLVESYPHTDPAEILASKHFKEHTRIISMCAHCRKIQNQAEPLKWEWIPAAFDYDKNQISHGLCPACSRFYYP